MSRWAVRRVSHSQCQYLWQRSMRRVARVRQGVGRCLQLLCGDEGMQKVAASVVVWSASSAPESATRERALADGVTALLLTLRKVR